MNGDSLVDMSIREVGQAYRRRTFSPVEVVAAALERIRLTEGQIHAWVVVDPERALAAARVAEQELIAGVDRGPLHGIPIGVKDIIDVAGWPTRCGSKSRDSVAPALHSANCAATLVDAGAIVLGKTVTQEFAAGVLSPPARNPWDTNRVPGGSSGGSAAAVAVGACLGALGSDTGGSIRIPAAACGVAGFKPTYGQLDTAGVFPLSWSLDTVGPIARTSDDAWLMWQALAKSTAANAVSGRSLAGLRVGVARSFFFESIQPQVLAAVESAIQSLAQMGVELVDVDWALASVSRACAFVINRVETAVVHERVATGDPARFACYGPELRLRVAAGRTIPAAVYLRATRTRELIRDSMAELFAEHGLHALLTPTLPTTAISADAPAIEGTGRDESVGAGWTRLTMPFNATGQPVLAVPAGFAVDGLPVGLQLAGRPGGESVLFLLGRHMEKALGTDRLRPPLLAVRE